MCFTNPSGHAADFSPFACPARSLASETTPPCVCVNFLVFRLCKCSRCGWGTWQLPLLIVFPPVSAHCEGVQCKSVHIIFHAHVCGHSHAPFAFPLVEALVSLCFCAGFIIFSTVHSIQFCIVVTLPRGVH